MKLFKTKINTPIGEMIAISTESGICLLDFTDKSKIAEIIAKIEKLADAKAEESENEILTKLKVEIAEYFEKKRTKFTVPVEFLGTEFQRKVWQNLQEIPFGHKLNYRQQSESMYAPKAIRAIASANGKNPVSIIVPCHRVVGSDGSLTGYAGGIWRKEFLLNLENEIPK